MDKELKIAIETIKEAWEIVLKYYWWDKLDTKYKTDKRDPVTQADLESEKHINQKIKEHFPNDKILSEETENELTDFSWRVRMIDPIDGTKDFIHKWGRFSVMIWLCIDWIPTVGVVLTPATGDLYYAKKWGGAYRINNKDEKDKIHVTTIDKISESTYFTKSRFSEKRTLNEEIEKALLFKEILPWWSVGTVLCEIASGQWECYILTNYKACKRDTCGPQIILEEAGWTVTDVSWNKINYLTWKKQLDNLLIGTNWLIHNNVIEETKKIFNSWK